MLHQVDDFTINVNLQRRIEFERGLEHLHGSYGHPMEPDESGALGGSIMPEYNVEQMPFRCDCGTVVLLTETRTEDLQVPTSVQALAEVARAAAAGHVEPHHTLRADRPDCPLCVALIRARDLSDPP